jgi:hypothetical protein
VAFPLSCIVRFKFDAQPELPAFDLFWYDGGMRPLVNDAYGISNDSLTREAMMFVGEKGIILAGFRGETPKLYTGSNTPVEEPAAERAAERRDANEIWINAFKNKTQSPGSFNYAGPVTETILLGAVALRAGKKVEYDSAGMKITNIPEANQYLTREYRKGWEL